MSGEKLAECAAAVAPNLPVVIVSGYSGKVNAEPLSANVKAFLAKPYPQAELLHTVRSVITDRQAGDA